MNEYIKECVEFYNGFKRLDINNTKDVLWDYFENKIKPEISREVREVLEGELESGKAIVCIELNKRENRVVFMEYYCWAPVIKENRNDEDEIYGRSDDVGCIRVYPEYDGESFVDIRDSVDWRTSAYDAVDSILRFERNLLGEFGEDGEYHVKKQDLEDTEFEFYLSEGKADPDNWCGPHPVFFVTGLMSERGMMR